MKITTSLCLVIYSLILCFANTVHADDAVYNGDGIDVYPLESADIQMVAEVITVSDTSGRDRFDVDVDMTFKNHGPQTTVQMGFPILSDSVEGERIEFDPHLRTWVNGEEVKITKKRGVPNPLNKMPDPSDAVYTYPVTFAQNETIKIKHHYAVGGTFYSEGSWRFVYILRTGALWKDVIENMKIIYKTKASSIHEITCTNPPNPTKEQHGEDAYFTWNLTDIKPKGDFVIEGNVRREPGADKEAPLETCVDFSQLQIKSSQYKQSHWPEIVSFWLVLALLNGLLSYKNAVNKNRSKRFWLIVGALTAPFTLLYIYFIPKRK